MTENEREALRMVRESKDPAAAIMIAIEVITNYVILEQPLSSTEQEVEILAG